MGLETLQEEIRRNAESEVVRIRKNYEKESNAIIDEAENKRSQVFEEAKNAGLKKADDLERQELSVATIKARRSVLKAKEEVVENAVAEVWEGLLDFRKSEDYGKLIGNVVKKVSADLGGKPVVYVCKEDEKLVSKLRVVSIETMGGVVLESEDDKVRIDCSFESVFEDDKDELREVFYRSLYEK